MSVLTQRGGVSRIQRVAVDATGRRYKPGGANVDPASGVYDFVTQYIQIRNVGANPAQIFFLEGDFTATENYVTLPAPSATSSGIWEGPAEINEFWMKSASGTTVEIVAYQRRG